MKNHAFIIQAHAYPSLLKKILIILEAKNHFFFINIDKKSNKNFSKYDIDEIMKINNVFLQKPMRVSHGGFSQIACTLSLLKFAISFPEVNFDYFHSLSGQDFPCLNNKEFDALFENNEKSYMFFDSPELVALWRKTKYATRLDKYYDYDFKIPLISENRSYFIKTKFNVKGLLNILNRKSVLNVYAGWSWFSWEKKVLEYVFFYLKKHPSFLRRFKMTSCADEIIFHTMLFDMTEALEIEKYNSLRFVEWHPKRETDKLPLILEEQEFEEIISSQTIFCRKVHPDKSAKLIAKLEQRIRENTDTNI